jgi:DNA invertase Pin-like site-specific DNA recombinase
MTRAAIYARVSDDRTEEGRSVREQEVEARAVCEREGWAITEVYTDNDRSASRFARKNRPEWGRLLRDLDSGDLDLVMLWEPSRGSRDLGDWIGFLDRCRNRGILIHVVSHRHTYDMAVSRDWKTLAEDGVSSAHESNQTSDRVRRDKADMARNGMPDGQVTFGYQRLYAIRKNKRVVDEQQPDRDTAPIVREVFARVMRGDPISTIAADLGMTRNRVRRIATNKAYIGIRHYNGEDHRATWPALVTEDQFYAAQRVLSDPIRRTTRPGRAKHLLSYLATCAVCGEGLSVRNMRGKPLYVCRHGTHVGIRAEWADRYVTAVVIERLSQPDIFEAVIANDDTAVLEARGEAERLRARLREAVDMAANGELSMASLGRLEAQLIPQIEAAERRATTAATPPVLRELLDPVGTIRDRWDALSVAARKDILRCLLTAIRIHPAKGKGRPSHLDPGRIELIPRGL